MNASPPPPPSTAAQQAATLALINFLGDKCSVNENVRADYDTQMHILMNALEMLGYDAFCAAFVDWSTANADAWTSDTTLNMKSLKRAHIQFVDKQVNVVFLFNLLAPIDRAAFFELVCAVCARDPIQLAAHKAAALHDACTHFLADLNSVGANFFSHPDDILKFVGANQKAIETRIASLLEPKPPASLLHHRDNMTHVWNHLQKIYNLLNPYAPIHFEPNIVNNLYDKVFSNVSSFVQQHDQSGSTDMPEPDKILASLMRPDIMEDIGALGNDPSQLQQLFSQMIKFVSPPGAKRVAAAPSLD